MSEDVQRKINRFSLSEGWSKTEHPLPPEWSGLSETMRAIGFQLTHDIRFGDWHEPIIEVYTASSVADESFYLWVTLGDCCEMIAVPDTPSLIELLAKLKPMVQIEFMSDLMGIVNDVHSLLTEYHSCGPLAESLDARERERRRNADERRLRTESAKAKK